MITSKSAVSPARTRATTCASDTASGEVTGCAVSRISMERIIDAYRSRELRIGSRNGTPASPGAGPGVLAHRLVFVLVRVIVRVIVRVRLRVRGWPIAQAHAHAHDHANEYEYEYEDAYDRT